MGDEDSSNDSLRQPYISLPGITGSSIVLSQRVNSSDD